MIIRCAEMVIQSAHKAPVGRTVLLHDDKAFLFDKTRQTSGTIGRKMTVASPCADVQPWEQVGGWKLRSWERERERERERDRRGVNAHSSCVCIIGRERERGNDCITVRVWESFCVSLWLWESNIARVWTTACLVVWNIDRERESYLEWCRYLLVGR